MFFCAERCPRRFFERHNSREKFSFPRGSAPSKMFPAPNFYLLQSSSSESGREFFFKNSESSAHPSAFSNIQSRVQRFV